VVSDIPVTHHRGMPEVEDRPAIYFGEDKSGRTSSSTPTAS
jgi:hypothetical protein